MWCAVAVPFRRAGVDHGFFAPSDDGLDGVGVVEIVEIAKDNKVYIGSGGKQDVDFLAQDFRFFEPEVGFIGFGYGTAGFEVVPAR